VLELESYIDKHSNMVKAAPAQDIEDQLAHDLAVIESRRGMSARGRVRRR
jgi:hypothetical protein